MTFKQNWEKADSQYQLEDDLVRNMISSSLREEVESFSVISGGCANLNVKVQLKNSSIPLLLRVYLRDKDAAYREQKISELLLEKIPVPKIYLILTLCCGACFLTT
jgi:hypothetical protein